MLKLLYIGVWSRPKFDLDLYVLGDDTSIIRGISNEPNIYLSWSISEIRTRLAPSSMFKPSSDFLTDRFKAVLLLWIVFAICVSFLPYFRICFFQPCGQLLGKGWPLGSIVCVFLSLSHMVYWVRRGTWLYRFLIFSFFLTFKLRINHKYQNLTR